MHWEVGIGAEYLIFKDLKASLGVLVGNSGGTDGYYDMLNPALPAFTVGGGFAYEVLKDLYVNFGTTYTIYFSEKTKQKYIDFKTGMPEIAESEITLNKDLAMSISLGLSYRFF